MGTETLAELQKAAQELRDGLKNVDEDIKKLTGRDPSDMSRPVNKRVQLKRNSFTGSSRQTEPETKQRRGSNSTGIRRWGRTLDSGGRISIDGERLESSGDEDESSKPAIQSVISADMKPAARTQTKDVEEDKKTKSRNRRMFGFLVGTLQKFKDEAKQNTLAEKKREEIEKKLEQKAEEERKEVSSQKKELFQARREKKQELKSLERKMENAMLKEQILAHNTHLKQFILLKSDPPIFYLPVKHNEETSKRLEDSKRTLKDLQDSRFNTIDEVDEGLFIAVNKGLEKGKDTNQKVEVEMRDVGHRNLFSEEKLQEDLDRDGDITMDDQRKENVDWSKMEGERSDEVVSERRSLNDETVENEVKGEERTELESDTKGVAGDEKDIDSGKEKSNVEALEVEGDVNSDMQMDEGEKYPSREEDNDVGASEKSETVNDQNCSESFQEEVNDGMAVSEFTEGNALNSTLEATSELRTADELQHGVGSEDVAV